MLTAINPIPRNDVSGLFACIVRLFLFAHRRLPKAIFKPSKSEKVIICRRAQVSPIRVAECAIVSRYHDFPARRLCERRLPTMTLFPEPQRLSTHLCPTHHKPRSACQHLRTTSNNSLWTAPTPLLTPRLDFRISRSRARRQSILANFHTPNSRRTGPAPASHAHPLRSNPSRSELVQEYHPWPRLP